MMLRQRAGLFVLPIFLTLPFGTLSVFGQIAPDTLRDFLENYLGSQAEVDDVRYAVAYADLNGDQMKEVIAHVVGKSWCGSGGCTTLVLQRRGKSFSIVARIPATYLPIRIVTGRTHQWSNLSVRVRGAQGATRFDRMLRFEDGQYHVAEQGERTAIRDLIGERSTYVALNSPP